MSSIFFRIRSTRFLRAGKVKEIECMELIQTSTYASPSFASTIKTFILKAGPVVNRFFLPVFAQPYKITGILGKAFPLISRWASC
jgi:hypothetical protein